MINNNPVVRLPRARTLVFASAPEMVKAAASLAIMFLLGRVGVGSASCSQQLSEHTIAVGGQTRSFKMFRPSATACHGHPGHACLPATCPPAYPISRLVSRWPTSATA